MNEETALEMFKRLSIDYGYSFCEKFIKKIDGKMIDLCRRSVDWPDRYFISAYYALSRCDDEKEAIIIIKEIEKNLKKEII